MDQGYWIIDMIFDTTGKPVDYRLLEMNRMFEKHTGLTNAINKTMKELVPDLDQFWFDTFGQVALTGIPTRFENEAVAMYRWFDVQATRVGDAGSHQVALFFRDITQRMQANREMKRQATRQAFQLQLTDLLRPLRNPDDVAPVVAKLLGEKLNLSRVYFADIDDAGGTAGGTAGSTFIIQRDWTANGMPSIAGLRCQLADFAPEIINSLRSGTMVLVENVSIDGRTAGHAQSYADINVRAHASFPLIKADNLVAFLSLCSATPLHWTDEHITLAQDTLERTWAAIESVQAQNALHVERDRSRSVLLGMSEGYVLLDQDWTIVEVNNEAACIARHQRTDLLNKNYWLASPDLVGTELEIFYRRLQSTGQPGAMDYLHTYTADEKRWIEIRAYPLKKGQLAIFLRDINDRKLTAQELQDASRRKDDFLAMLAHELRNPLAPIGAAAALIQRAKLDPVQLRETSEVIGRQVKHMTHLINDLLDVSRVNRGLVELDKDLLQMTQLVNDAVEQVAPLIRARGHRLSLHQTPHTTLVVGDKKRLVQVIANLLHNAAKYTPDGGDLRLTTEVREARIIIELTDNGIGMTGDLASHAFELFAQAERTSDRASGGLGLGLALVKSLVELHGGSVSCDSAGLGKGSRFCVFLPRAHDAAADAPQYLNNPAVATPTESLHIMVVDDNADAARMLAMVLENAGHRVIVEHGSRAALQRAKIDIPQVFLLDIGLPEMDGYELARRLRAQPETADATLIAITGYGQKQDKQNAFDTGFDHHLVKPVDMESLSEALTQRHN